MEKTYIPQIMNDLMERVSFEEYQAAKAEIIGGVECWKTSATDGERIRTTYTTKKNGVFFEVSGGGGVMFWSGRHPAIRVYDDRPAQRSEEPPHYGKLLGERIRATANMGGLSEFEKFVLDRGNEFPAEEDLKAAYDRAWRARHGILISKEEFLAEANLRRDHPNAADAYDALAELVTEKKLDPGGVFKYARFGWCLDNPEAVVVCNTYWDRWSVNNCDTEITTEKAAVLVNGEWGFEASRVEIMDTPYYESTDWNWIRFRCAGMYWLMCNGSLYQVYH